LDRLERLGVQRDDRGVAAVPLPADREVRSGDATRFEPRRRFEHDPLAELALDLPRLLGRDVPGVEIAKLHALLVDRSGGGTGPGRGAWLERGTAAGLGAAGHHVAPHAQPRGSYPTGQR